MHEFAAAYDCHGWQMQIFAAENGPDALHTPFIEASLVRIVDLEQTETGGFASMSYTVNEVVTLLFQGDGSVLIGGDTPGD